MGRPLIIIRRELSKVTKSITTMSDSTGKKFGLLFDIDGVLLRGKEPIDVAPEAMKMIYQKGEFIIPTVFCTNAFGKRERKAANLSEALGIKVDPDQIIMSQSPLEMFVDYHDKCVLVVGPEHDGGFFDVAQELGFENIVTLDDVRKAFPYLDWVDRKLWPKTPVQNDPNFPKIDAVVVLGEPLNWEGALQLILDVIQTDGRPGSKPPANVNQIPVLASNMDLQWMAKAPIPRFGNGAFLLCLEALYEKMTGTPLEYTALVGKPSVVTYQYSLKLMEEYANKMDQEEIKTVYCFGDNPLSDIYGANLFTQTLEQAKEKGITTVTNVSSLEQCVSVLVGTGVYDPSEPEPESVEVDHGHRDLPFKAQLCKANIISDNVLTAMQKVFEIENIKE